MTYRVKALQELLQQMGSTPSASVSSIENEELAKKESALASVQKQGTNLEQRMLQTDVTPTEFTDLRNPLEKAFNLPENQNWLFDIFDVLGRPQQAVFNVLKQSQSNEKAYARGSAFMEGLTGEADKVYFGDILRGGKERPEGTVDWTDVVGFAGDVFLDPADLAFIPVKAVSGAIKGVTSVAAKADNVLDGMKGAVEAFEAADDIRKATGVVTEEVAKKAASLGLDAQEYANLTARTNKAIEISWEAKNPLQRSAKLSSYVDPKAYETGQQMVELVKEGQIAVDDATKYLNKLAGIQPAANNSLRMTSNARYYAQGLDDTIDEVTEMINLTSKYLDKLDETEKFGYFQRLGKNYKVIKAGQDYLSPTDIVIRSLWGTAKTGLGVTGDLAKEFAKYAGVGDQMSQLQLLLKNTFSAAGGLPKGLLREVKDAFGKENFTRMYAAEKKAVIDGIAAKAASELGEEQADIGVKLNQYYALKEMSGKNQAPVYQILTGKNVFPFDIASYNELANAIKVPRGQKIGELLPIIDIDGRKWIDLTQFNIANITRKKGGNLDQLVTIPQILKKEQVDALEAYYQANPAFQEAYKEFVPHWTDMMNKMSDYLGIDYRTPGAYARNAISADYELKKVIEIQNKLDAKSAEKLGKSTFRGNPKAFAARAYNVGAQEANIWSSAAMFARAKNQIVDMTDNALKFKSSSDLAMDLANEFDTGKKVFTPRLRKVLSAMMDSHFSSIRKTINEQMQAKFDIAETTGEIKVTSNIEPFYTFNRNGVKASSLKEILADDEINELVWFKQNASQTDIDMFIKKFGQAEFDAIPAEEIAVAVEETTGRVLRDNFKKIFEGITVEPVKVDLEGLTYTQRKTYETLVSQEDKRIPEIVDEIIAKNEDWSKDYTKEELTQIVDKQVRSLNSQAFLDMTRKVPQVTKELKYTPEDVQVFGESDLAKEFVNARTIDEQVTALRKIETDPNVPAAIKQDYIENIKPKLDEYDDVILQETNKTATAEAIQKPIIKDEVILTSLQGEPSVKQVKEEMLTLLQDELNQAYTDGFIDEEVKIINIDVHGSRVRGDFKNESDLDIVIEYEGNISEDSLFNILNEETREELYGVKIDINPITKTKTGSMQDYMTKSAQYDAEKLAKVRQATAETTALKALFGDDLTDPAKKINELTGEELLKTKTKEGVEYSVEAATPAELKVRMEDAYEELRKLDELNGTDLSKQGVFKHYPAIAAGDYPVLKKGDKIIGVTPDLKTTLGFNLNTNKWGGADKGFKFTPKIDFKFDVYDDTLDQSIKEALEKTYKTSELDKVGSFNIIRYEPLNVPIPLEKRVPLGSNYEVTWDKIVEKNKDLAGNGIKLVNKNGRTTIEIIDDKRAQAVLGNIYRDISQLDKVMGTNYRSYGILGEVFGVKHSRVARSYPDPMLTKPAKIVAKEITPSAQAPMVLDKPKEWYLKAREATLAKEIGVQEAKAAKVIQRRIKKMPDTRPVLQTVHWDSTVNKLVWTDSFMLIRLNTDIPFLKHSTEIDSVYPDTNRFIPQNFVDTKGVDVDKLNKVINAPEEIKGLYEYLIEKELIKITDDEAEAIKSFSDEGINLFRRNKIESVLDTLEEGKIRIIKFGENVVDASRMKDALDIIGNPGEILISGNMKPMFTTSPIGDALILPLRAYNEGSVLAEIQNKFFDVTSDPYDVKLPTLKTEITAPKSAIDVKTSAPKPTADVKIKKPKISDDVKEFAKTLKDTGIYAIKQAEATQRTVDYVKPRFSIEGIIEKTKKQYEKDITKFNKELDVDAGRAARRASKINITNQELKAGNLEEIAKKMSPEDQKRFKELTKEGLQKAKDEAKLAKAEQMLTKPDYDKLVSDLKEKYVLARQRSFIKSRVVVEYTEKELLEQRYNQINSIFNSVKSAQIKSVDVAGKVDPLLIKTDEQKELLRQLLTDAGETQSKIDLIMQDDTLMNNVNAYLASYQAKALESLAEKQEESINFIRRIAEEHPTFSEDILYSINDYIDKFAREGRNAKIYKSTLSHIAIGDIGDQNALIRFLPKTGIITLDGEETFEQATERLAKLSPKEMSKLAERSLPRGYKVVENPKALIAKMASANKLAQDPALENAIKWMSAHMDPEKGSIIIESNLANLLMLNVKEDANALLELVDFTNKIFKRFKLMTIGFNMRNVLGIFTNAWLGGVDIKEMPYLISQSDKVFREGSQLLKLNAVLSPQQWADEITSEQKKVFNIYKTFIEGQFTLPVPFKEFRSRGLSGTASELQDLARKTLDDQGSETIETILDMEKKSKLATQFEKPLDVINAVSLGNGWGNETVDAYGRMMVLIKAMDEEAGSAYLEMLNVADPIEAVRLVMFDPKNISQTESEVLRRLIPFYSFTKMNLAYHMHNIENNPSRYYRLIKTMRRSWQLAGLKEEDVDTYKLDQMYIPLPGATKDGKYFAVKANLPVSDLIEFVSDPLKRILGSTAPYVKAPFEVATNTTIFTGQPIERFAGEKSKTLPFLDKKTEYLLGQTGLDSPLRTVTGLLTGDMAGFTGMLSEGNVMNTRMSQAYDKLNALQDGVKNLKQKGIELPTLVRKEQEDIQTPKLTQVQRMLQELAKIK